MSQAQQGSAPTSATAQQVRHSDAVLSLRGMTVRFSGSSVAASEGIDLDLVSGRVLALVGESGSGKSVTALGSLGLLPQAATVTGSVLLSCDEPGDNRDGAFVELIGADRSVLDNVRGRVIGTIFQEPSSALDPLLTIGAQIREVIVRHSREPRSRSRIRARVHELLGRVGLPDVERIAGSYPHQLSGGQLQRACVALALACNPKVIIADEPTTALDVTVQAGILDLLRQLTDEGMAVLLITHDMAVVADIADEVAVMQKGHIVERGSVDKIFNDPQHSYTRQLLDAVPRLDALRRTLSPQADPSGAGSGEPAPIGVVSSPTKPEQPLVEVTDLDVVHRARRRRSVHAVRGVSLTIAPGEVLGLVGESGSGKSTIAGTLTGLVPVTSGSVRVAGVEVAGASRRALLPVRRSTGVVYQNPASALNPRRTVGASIAEPLMLHSTFDSARRRARVRELLDQVELPHSMADRYPHQMSGGQRQRVAIARALALKPRLVVADEPTSALDVSVQAKVLKLLTSLQAELGFACLFVSHDLAVIEQIAARTVVLSRGRIVEEGPTVEVLSHPREDYTRALVSAVPIPDPAIQRARRAASVRR
ncbi:ABC transporter ATP-binding protein [Cutibacterium sp. WCA-380-WT-3A]|uniref:ABC transporter ATP-binding protein n=1 Tax=Cutibacterium porci TaxID=2605781 RepID=A0A7K0J9M2_9ACTN|nr:ABC transporter ATP-binding protein [Cutibacterium porci]MSS46646.1 ABC transporter ATP-binding protein [Cutibacterium porci]